MPRYYPASTTGELTNHILGNNFAASLEDFKLKTRVAIQAVVKKSAMLLYDEIVSISPVDTGRFRANNQIGIDSMDMSNLSESGLSSIFPEKTSRQFPTPRGMKRTHYTPIASMALEKAKLAGYKVGSTIYIYNNLKYAVPLEYGHSKQAPRGVYRISALKFKTYLNAACLASQKWSPA